MGRAYCNEQEEVLSLHPKGGMIHLCGNHVRHIPTWAQMSSLKSIQLSSVANEEVEAHVEGLRSDQVIYVGPTSVLPLARIMDATGGCRVILAADIQLRLPTIRGKTRRVKDHTLRMTRKVRTAATGPSTVCRIGRLATPSRRQNTHVNSGRMTNVMAAAAQKRMPAYLSIAFPYIRISII